MTMDHCVTLVQYISLKDDESFNILDFKTRHISIM